MTWFIFGLMLAASLVYVFYLPGRLFLGPEKTRAGYLRERKDAVYENLRDLNFEYKAGKVPDADYASLKSSLQDEAATILAESRDWKIPRPKKEPEINKIWKFLFAVASRKRPFAVKCFFYPASRTGP